MWGWAVAKSDLTGGRGCGRWRVPVSGMPTKRQSGVVVGVRLPNRAKE